MRPKTIGLIAHTGKPAVADLVNAIAKEFDRFSISILIEKETAAIAGKKSDHSITQMRTAEDLLVVAGSDGTILHVVAQTDEVVTPITVNTVGTRASGTSDNT